MPSGCLSYELISFVNRTQFSIARLMIKHHKFSVIRVHLLEEE